MSTMFAPFYNYYADKVADCNLLLALFFECGVKGFADSLTLSLDTHVTHEPSFFKRLLVRCEHERLVEIKCESDSVGS